MRCTVIASFLDSADTRRALSELARAGISPSAVEIEPERNVPAAQLTKQRHEAEELVVGPGIAVPGPSGRAAVTGAIWGAVIGVIAGMIAGAIASGGSMGITLIIAVVCGATSGAVFGGFWAGAARADEEAEKDERIEKRATAVEVSVAGRAEVIRAVRALKQLNPQRIGVVDSNGIPLDDESDEALWVQES